MTTETHQPGRFLTLDRAAEEQATSHSQLYALVRRGDLPALKLGGRCQWHIERAAPETYLFVIGCGLIAWWPWDRAR